MDDETREFLTSQFAKMEQRMDQVHIDTMAEFEKMNGRLDLFEARQASLELKFYMHSRDPYAHGGNVA